MNKKKLLMILCTLGFSYAGADTGESLDYSSFYLNLGAGWGYISNLPTGAAAINAGFGYSFNRYVALEAEWTALPSSQWGSFSNYNIYNLAIKGTLPLDEYWSLYGKLGSGVGYSTWSGTEGSPSMYNSAFSATSWLAQGTVGLSLAVSNRFDLYLENSTYVPISGAPGNFATTNATFFGVQFNFSAPQARTTAVDTALANSTKVEPATGMPVASEPVVVMPIASESAPAPIPESSIVPIAATATVVAAPIAIPLDDTRVANSMCSNAPSFNNKRIIKQANGRQYVAIQKCDTLYSISKYTKISESRLIKLNRLPANGKVEIGKRLYLK